MIFNFKLIVLKMNLFILNVAFFHIHFTVTNLQYVYFPHQLTFYAARNYCLANGMDLAIGPTQREHDAIMDYITSLGSQVQDLKNIWIGLVWSSAEESFEWLNGQLLSIVEWENGEPKNIGECAALQVANSTWFASLCSDLRGVVCQSDRGKGNEFTSLGMDMNYTAARSVCLATDSDLPSITNNQVKENLDEFISDHSIPQNSIWLGLIKENGYYAWINGGELGFKKWHKTIDGDYVHIHNSLYHAGSNNGKEFLCGQPFETKTENSNIYKGHYLKYGQDLSPSVEERQTIPVRSNMGCSVLCNKDDDCVAYTLTVTTCRTYGNYTTTITVKGSVLWKRIIKRI